MNELLELKFPTEIANNILTFSRHPLADMLVPLFETHVKKMVGYNEHYIKQNKKTPSESFAKRHFLKKNISGNFDAQSKRRFKQLYY